MKINPLPKSKQLTGDWFEKGLKEFEDLIKERLVDCERINDKKKTKRKLTDKNNLCGDCCLEFFYYLDNSYKKAIWIKVYNLNGVNIWIRVDFRENGRKKVNIYSECNLNCLELDFVENYALPPDFDVNGIWMSEKGRTVANTSFSEILDEICNYLDCLCTAKCKI